MSGSYVGSALVTLLNDGRNVRLEADLCYLDASGLAWPVPKGAVVDGASIPRPFWTIVGGPFEGKYRDASIIHDWYCDLRTRTWEATHHMFHEAMLTSDVSPIQAKIPFFAVWWGGPRWNTRVSLNTNLSSGGMFEYRVPDPSMVRSVVVSESAPSERIPRERWADVARQTADHIAATDPSLEEIENLAEAGGPLQA